VKKTATELTIDALLARNYAVRLWRCDGRSIVEIEELSLVAEGPTVQEALDALDRAKRDYFGALHRLGRAQEIPVPVGESANRVFWLGHRSFCFRVLFAGAVAALLLLAIVPAIKLQLVWVNRDLQVVGRSVPYGIFEGIEGLRAMPEERQKRAAAGMRTFIEALGPVLREGKAALEDQGLIEPAPGGEKRPNER
jgi:hypothetical protein